MQCQRSSGSGQRRRQCEASGAFPLAEATNCVEGGNAKGRPGEGNCDECRDKGRGRAAERIHQFFARPGHTVLHPVYMRADKSRSPDRSTTLKPRRLRIRASATSSAMADPTAACPPTASYALLRMSRNGPLTVTSEPSCA